MYHSCSKKNLYSKQYLFSGVREDNTLKQQIGSHFVLRIHKWHKNLNHAIIIEGNVNSDCKIISKYHFETIFLQHNSQRNINSPINVHKMLLTFYKIQSNLIMPDGPCFMLRWCNNMLLNESPHITFMAIP